MCGIAGAWLDINSELSVSDQVKSMTQVLEHRGPDSQGFWSNPELNVAMGHRRLAILDLSVSGHQPMKSSDGRFVISYNGEIYNHSELRVELENNTKINWQGTSDTETLLRSIEIWGLEEALCKFRGMFAFALWDNKESELVLARDRVGEKPLYYGKTKQGFYFSSELKSIQSDDFNLEIDHSVIFEYMKSSCVPETKCIYKGFKKLKPGTYIRIKDKNCTQEIPYWSFQNSIKKIRKAKFPQSMKSFQQESTDLEDILCEVIKDQMISDVPLGSFLSGGVDSSLVTALMQKNSNRPIKTFSMCFEDSSFDEAHFAKPIAEHLGTDHTEYLVTEKDALSLIPRLTNIYDEPFADSSQIPTLLLCRHARKEVTVALTGDGGDEIFGGYNRYLSATNIFLKTRQVPELFLSSVLSFIKFISTRGDRGNKILKFLIKSSGLPGSTLYKVNDLAETLRSAQSISELYLGLTSTFQNPSLFLKKKDTDITHVLSDLIYKDLEPQEWMMLMDSTSYLPADILVKVDRASMSASLETRAPFLDRRVIEAAWSIKLDSKIKGKEGKIILKDILYRYVPKNMLERPKQGFSIPLDKWLRGELSEWASELLSLDLINELNIFEASEVNKLWESHLSQKENNGHKLWTVLMLQSWLKNRKENIYSAKENLG